MIQQTEILQAEQQLLEAIKTSSVSFLEKVLHDDLLFLAPNGQVITKSIDLASHKAGHMQVDEIKPTIEEIKIMDDTAVVVLVYDTIGKMMGNPIQGKFRYIRIWKRFDESLQVIGGSCFKIE